MPYVTLGGYAGGGVNSAFKATAPERRRDINPAPRPLIPIRPIRVMTIGRTIMALSFRARRSGNTIFFSLVRARMSKTTVQNEKFNFLFFLQLFEYKRLNRSSSEIRQSERPHKTGGNAFWEYLMATYRRPSTFFDMWHSRSRSSIAVLSRRRPRNPEFQPRHTLSRSLRRLRGYGRSGTRLRGFLCPTLLLCHPLSSFLNLSLLIALGHSFLSIAKVLVRFVRLVFWGEEKFVEILETRKEAEEREAL